jgi:hypothetical protein
MQERYYSEVYKDTHIALLWDKGRYTVFINKEHVPGWKIESREQGIQLCRERVDSMVG